MMFNCEEGVRVRKGGFRLARRVVYRPCRRDGNIVLVIDGRLNDMLGRFCYQHALKVKARYEARGDGTVTMLDKEEAKASAMTATLKNRTDTEMFK